MVRNPVVAGQFYTSNATRLEKEIKGYIDTKVTKINALGCVSPHAGYMYSGQVAGSVLSHIALKGSYIILGPNHSGMGARFGLDMNRNWLTPLGEVKIDKDLAEAVLDTSRLVKTNELCHDYEHSIEVQLPFLQVLSKDFEFVPIVIAHGDSEEYKEIGKNLATAIKKTKKEVTIIASSDMTHYETHESAQKKDRLAIDKILKLDIDGFLEQIHKYNISMCGYAPTAIMMSATKELGAKKASLIRYQTSGDTSGDYSAVVGYAGIVVY